MQIPRVPGHTPTLAAVACAALLSTVLLAGCPTNRSHPGKATVALTAQGGAKADVPLGSMEQFVVTVTEVAFEETSDGDGEPERVIVFDGAVDVDLVDLTTISEVLSSSEVPAGTYTKVRISIENPRLVLKEDPGTVLTDIQLTANGRVFVSDSFEVPEGNILILLELGGLKLVALGNGGFTFTPQLEVDVDVVSADAQLSGEVVATDPASGEITVALQDGTADVVVTDADIYLPTDTDTPTGVPASILVGDSVRVTGTLMVDGSVVATTVVILTP